MKSTRDHALPSPAPVERSNLTALILQRLRDYVVDHRFGAGDRLPPERELAVRLNVSRPSLRRALDWLDRRGALRRVQGGGTFLQTGVLPALDKHVNGGRPLDASPAELNEACIAVAAALLRLATGRVTREEVEKLKAQLDEPHNPEDVDWQREELRFHLTVAKLAGNSILTGTLESLLTQAMAIWTHGPPKDGQRHHREILDALARSDANSAVAHLQRCLARHFAVAE